MEFILNHVCQMLIDESDYAGVKTAAGWVEEDLEKVFGKEADSKSSKAIIAGSFKSNLIKKICDTGVINTEGILNEDGSSKWEVYKTSLVKNPLPGIDEAIVIQGSDKRGTMYGLLSVSEHCGVSPFVNWSDAMPVHREEVIFGEDFFGVSKEPSVKFRGIFINDEWPAFGTWATKRFGGVNASCYREIFELLLRLHGNYMWPAMWASNFSLDGPGLENARLADELGIVMSTSHHEPCMRTGEEYRMVRGPESIYGDAWDFLSNRQGIIRFWEDGLKRNAPFENVITMGMRGERDTAIMGNATLAENIALLKDIIKTQNELIRKYINPDLTRVPRQIVLFTEVEKFYYGDDNTPGLIEDPEMDGITVVFSDSNYGYTRTLPSKSMLSHKGGYGMYYHVDMHGGAYSYEWIGSTYLPRIWDQLSTAYDYGVRDIWVVNVGDLVSQELEVSYIMKLACDFEAYGTAHPNNTGSFVRAWLEHLFAGYFAPEDIARLEEIICGYSLINERCKHEIMNEKIYHPVHFGEARDLYELSKKIMTLCDDLKERCPKEIYTAFYELIYYPAYGTANLSRTWVVSMWNKFYANQNRNSANDLNEEIDEGIRADEKLIEDFHALAGGKFYGQALSEHFGFRFWNDSNNQLPTRLYVYPANKKRMLVSKADEEWYLDGREYTLREMTITDFLRLDVDSFDLEISCGSRIEAAYEISVDVPWLSLSSYSGRTGGTDVVTVSIDRSKIISKKVFLKKTAPQESPSDENAPETENLKDGIESQDELVFGKIVISDREDCLVTLIVPACSGQNNSSMEGRLGDFLESDGIICIEAEHYCKLTSFEDIHYELLKPYGRTGSGIKLYPTTFDGEGVEVGRLPYAEYRFYTPMAKKYEAEFVFAPSLPVNDSNHQYFGLAVNNNKVIKADTVLDESRPVFNSRQWDNDNRRNAKIITVDIEADKGSNTLKYYQINPNLILERIVLWDKEKKKKESYLGPRESYRR